VRTKFWRENLKEVGHLKKYMRKWTDDAKIDFKER
jgi:hypothetical protein